MTDSWSAHERTLTGGRQPRHTAQVPRPATGFAYLDDAPGVLAMAHRGGAKHSDLIGIENTVAAFAHAMGLGYRYLETDVHATRDGVLVAFHDDALDRMTDGAGRIRDLTYDAVATARIAGVHAIPRMDELLESFPSARFNVDLKSMTAVEPLVAVLDKLNAHDRVCVGSFNEPTIRRFRRLVSRPVATAGGPLAVAAMRFGLQRCVGDPGSVFQIPTKRGPLSLVSRELVERAHASGKHVHVWTIDDPAEMSHLIDLGVDGIVTDRTDVLREVLQARGLWA